MSTASWPVVWTSTIPDTVTIEQQTLAEQLAVSSLQTLTLGRVGTTQVTLIPDQRYRAMGLPRFGRQPEGVVPGNFLLDGVFPSALDLEFPLAGINPVVLPGPVAAIVQVTVAGQVLDASEYRVENGEYLVRLGAEWPRVYGDSFTVTYLKGFPADSLAQHAAGVLAAEFLRAITGDKKCRLPSGVTDLVRQGVTMKLPTGIFDGGQTGITEVDAFLKLWNPNKLATKPGIYSPDRQRSREVSWRP